VLWGQHAVCNWFLFRRIFILYVHVRSMGIYVCVYMILETDVQVMDTWLV